MGEEEGERAKGQKGERERERSASRHLASHTGDRRRLAFHARKRSTTSHGASRTWEDRSLTTMPLAQEFVNPVGSLPTSKGRRDMTGKKAHDCVAARAREFAAPSGGRAGQHTKEIGAREKGS